MNSVFYEQRFEGLSLPNPGLGTYPVLPHEYVLAKENERGALLNWFEFDDKYFPDPDGSDAPEFQCKADPDCIIYGAPGLAAPRGTSINGVPTIDPNKTVGMYYRHPEWGAIDPTIASSKMCLGTGPCTILAGFLSTESNTGIPSWLMGRLPDAATGASDFSPNLRLSASSPRTAALQLLTNQASPTIRWNDNGVEYYNTVSMSVLGFDTTLGWTIRRNKVTTLAASGVTAPFTDGRFQLFTILSGATSNNFKGPAAIFATFNENLCHPDNAERLDTIESSVGAYLGVA